MQRQQVNAGMVSGMWQGTSNFPQIGSFPRHCPRKNAKCVKDSYRTNVKVREKEKTSFNVQDKLEFLRNDLLHLFDEQGIDASAYDSIVDFRDPITKYSNLSGYLFNIKMLKKFFNPIFELHDIKQTEEYAITTRWTMAMELSFIKSIPEGSAFCPQIIFTGTSIYVFNPENGKINGHIDTWDSISNQEFFSFEGFADFLSQVLQLYRTSNPAMPRFTVLKRKSSYQIRRYPPTMVASTVLDHRRDSNNSHRNELTTEATMPGIQAFSALINYVTEISGGVEVPEVASPVLTSSSGKMLMCIEGVSSENPSTLPSPEDTSIEVYSRPEAIWAVRTFRGIATPTAVETQVTELRKQLARDGYKVKHDEPWLLAQYHDPTVPFLFRRNEVLLRLEEFSLWS